MGVFFVSFAVMSEATIKEGWLYREESVEGSLTTWKKRWNVLTLQKILCYKSNNASEPISTVSVASIEEMAFGANVGDKTRTYAFSLTTPRGLIKLAAENEEERESWVSTLRALVPKAKIELAKEMLMRKAKRKANLELAQQQIKEAIESILRDSKRVAVRGGFKTYADNLAECFHGLLGAVDAVTEMGLNCAKQCAYSISSIVDAANSAAAICANKAIQDEIVVRTRDIAVETANLLGYATTAAHDNVAQTKMYGCIESIQEQVRQILELLAAAGALQQELDDAKLEIERALEAPPNKFRSDASIEACIDSMNDRAKVLSTTIKNIANNACVTPERVGQYSKEAASLMCELLDATNLIAVQSGVDINDPAYIAGGSDISEHKKQQIESLLAAAKGFAAATTNMIDLLKQIPNQEDDENLQFRLSMATRSADNALNAFMGSTNGVDISGGPQSASGHRSGIASFAAQSVYGGSPVQANVSDPESELLQALSSIEQAVTRLSMMPTNTPQRTQPGFQNPTVPTEYDASNAVIRAARKLCEASAGLMGSAHKAQQHVRQHDGDTYYRKDPNWTSGLVSSAQQVAETTGQLVDVCCNPSSSPEDIVAAVRCLNGATARLVAFSRAKGDPNSPELQNLEQASRTIARAANNLVDIAKRQKAAETDYQTDAEISKLKNAPRTRQIKMEFEAQARIAKLEVDLDAARQYLFKLRRAVYGNEEDLSLVPQSTNSHPRSSSPRGAPPRAGGTKKFGQGSSGNIHGAPQRQGSRGGMPQRGGPPPGGPPRGRAPGFGGTPPRRGTPPPSSPRR